MKNKRMKLTALAMSVLMAMSTITSVTWAADLFTDGAPAEVAVEAPAEVISDGETEEVPAEEAPTASATLDEDGKILGVKEDTILFHYGPSGDVVVDYTIVMERQSPFHEPTEIQYANQPATVIRTRPQDCYWPERAIFSIIINGKEYITGTDNVNYADGMTSYVDRNGVRHDIGNEVLEGYIISSKNATSKGGYFGHSQLVGLGTAPYEVVTKEATCAEEGEKVLWDGCAWCGSLIRANGTEISSGAVKAEILANGIDTNGDGINDSLDINGDKKTDARIQPIPKSEHSYDMTNPIVVTDEYATNHPVVGRLHPYNCRWEIGRDGKGEMVAIDDSKDAYYYLVVECKNCHEPAYYDKIVIRDVTGIYDVGTFYEPVSNVLGFVAQVNGKLVGIYFNQQAYNGVNYGSKIPADKVLDPVVPILQDCGRMGYYQKTVYESDTHGPVSREEVPVSKGHAWSNDEVAPGGWPLGATVSATEDDKILKDANGSNGFAVVRNARGDVTDVKSINCVTTAKYQLYHQCFACGTREKVGDVKTSSVNPDLHRWPDKWAGPRDADNKYYMKDDTYHTKYTYLYRICELCGKKETKAYTETVEKHRLIETKVENGDSKEPTCGEDGYYEVQLECPCGFVDTNSRKKTSIPHTDEHDFTDVDPTLEIHGTVQVGGRVAGEPETKDPTHRVYATVVRKCTKCGRLDSNGIDGTVVNSTGESVVVDSFLTGRTFTDYKPAKVDPSTGAPYSCSVGSITVNFNWAGKVDGKPVQLSKKVTVPYYPSELSYSGSRTHEPATRIENKQDGSYDKVVYCAICGDEISRETVVVTKIPAPTVTAKAVDYNTITVSWTPVEGASSYRLYYRSADLGVTTWTVVRNVSGTSFNHTGLVTGAKYRYTVRAVVNGALGEFSKTGSVACPKLTAPVINSVTSVEKGKKITWSKVDGASGYIIQRKGSDGKWTRVATVKKGARVTWTDKKATAGSSYRVRAYRTVYKANYDKTNAYGPFSAAK